MYLLVICKYIRSNPMIPTTRFRDEKTIVHMVSGDIIVEEKR